ncbi:hypothetical protein BHU72_15120 [Desulfuribacillus stibiiarsenatis]|uniref:Uncharacterized protein n=1 Tax=Desulfuribacillus stibiiarsenatis TaxID=1390249 RepID=A0A1E5L662_9FIRM|nr:hypothetical protein [Desulfuribacillus stibiiarsenatis]OEH85554.1 hypothetical protein BHU72_15120 [Desulfuribacillus stibiiarsenatis]
MKSNHWAQMIENITSIIPEYSQDGGNITHILLTDGQHVTIDKKNKNVIQQLKAQSSYNVDLLMRQHSSCFAKRHLLPIPIHPKCILVPIKVRKPYGENDGAYGYVSVDHIDGIEAISPDSLKENKNSGLGMDILGGFRFRSIITLKDNLGTIPTSMQASHISQQVAIVQSVRQEYFKNVYGIRQDEGYGVNQVKEIVVSLATR